MLAALVSAAGEEVGATVPPPPPPSAVLKVVGDHERSSPRASRGGSDDSAESDHPFVDVAARLALRALVSRVFVVDFVAVGEAATARVDHGCVHEAFDGDWPRHPKQPGVAVQEGWSSLALQGPRSCTHASFHSQED